jgi:hypothetical protein
VRHSPTLVDTLRGSSGSYLFGNLRESQSVGLFRSIALISEQMADDQREAAAAISRVMCPSVKRAHRLRLRVTRGEERAMNVSLYKYDGQVVYNGQITYDETQPTGFWGVPLPDGFTALRATPGAASETELLYGVDFTQVPRQLRLYENPFFIFPVQVGSDGEFIEFYVYGDQNTSLPYEQFGYVVDTREPDAINAAWDTLLLGANALSLRQTIGALTGCPPIAEDGEVVQDLHVQSDCVVLATDRRIYKYPAGVTLTVSTGDVLRAGDFPVADVQVFEGPACRSAGLLSVSFGVDALDPSMGVSSGVVFPAGETPVVYTETSNGGLDVRWSLGGSEADVEAFWLAANAGSRMREILLRQYQQLPETIDPLKFIFDAVFTSNILAIVVDVTNLDPQRLAVQAPVMRRVLPPQVIVLGCVIVAGGGDTVTFTSADGPGSFMMVPGDTGEDSYNLEDNFDGVPVGETL